MKNLIFGVQPAKYPKKGNQPAVDVGEVAIWNEYGTRTAPPRPAFRMGLEAAQRKNKKLIGAQLQNISRRILTGRKAEIDKSLTVLLTQIGRSAKSETVQVIEQGLTAPNAQTTVAKKGFDHPLYVTGLLMKHVDYEVR